VTGEEQICRISVGKRTAGLAIGAKLVAPLELREALEPGCKGATSERYQRKLRTGVELPKAHSLS